MQIELLRECKTSVIRSILLMVLTLLFPALVSAAGSEEEEDPSPEPVKSMLVIGDSMSGWLGERLNAYGAENGFEVGTIVWDGATIQKYADNPNLKHIIDKQDPQVVIFCLGLNNLGESVPERLRPEIEKLRKAVGDREIVWVGPPTWPGKQKWTALNNWLEQEIGEGRYFNTFPLTLPRQSSTNPHPTREGASKWGDAVMEWLATTDLDLPGVAKPTGVKYSKGKFYLYKRMKERL